MDKDFPTQDITIYHKDNNKWFRYNVIASFRHTSIINRTKTGISSNDTALIRIFDKDNKKYEVDKEDIIIDRNISDEIKSTPLTELQKKYGKNNVFKVKSIDILRFGTELDHIKIGCI